MRSYAGGTCRRPGAQRPAFGAERVARGSDLAATGARARSAHAIGAKRVTRGDAGSHSALLRSLAAPLPHPHPCTLGGSCLLAQNSKQEKGHQPWPSETPQTP